MTDWTLTRCLTRCGTLSSPTVLSLLQSSIPSRLCLLQSGVGLKGWSGSRLVNLKDHTNHANIWAIRTSFVAVPFADEQKEPVIPAAFCSEPWPLQHTHWEAEGTHLLCLSEAVNNRQPKTLLLVLQLNAPPHYSPCWLLAVSLPGKRIWVGPDQSERLWWICMGSKDIQSTLLLCEMQVGMFWFKDSFAL